MVQGIVANVTGICHYIDNTPNISMVWQQQYICWKTWDFWSFIMTMKSSFLCATQNASQFVYMHYEGGLEWWVDLRLQHNYGYIHGSFRGHISNY